MTPVLGDLWWPHVYMPAQNPYNPDMSGINADGPLALRPLVLAADPGCGSIPAGGHAVVRQPRGGAEPLLRLLIGDPAAAPPYDVDGPCTRPEQPPEMPGTPNVSWGAEAFLDTMVVNGTAYPTSRSIRRPTASGS